MGVSAREAFGEALLEYLVLVAPVAFYVALEAYHKQELHFFFNSPEWAIATIFLQFQGLYLYVTRSRKRGALSESRVGILVIVALSVVVASAMNALESMHEETDGKLRLRGILFGASSILFLLFVAASKFTKMHSKSVMSP